MNTMIKNKEIDSDYKYDSNKKWLDLHDDEDGATRERFCPRTGIFRR